MNTLHRWFCRSDVWKRALEKGLPWVLDGLQLGEHVLEIGPGPGLTTDILRQTFRQVTAVEINRGFARKLSSRMKGTNVNVIQADAVHLPILDGTFTGAVCFTMLHHVPSKDLQNQLLKEVQRVLRPGGVFAGSDSLWSRGLQLFHLFDTLVPVEPAGFIYRLASAGFVCPSADLTRGGFRFRAQRPETVTNRPSQAGSESR